MYFHVGPFRIGKPKNPGALALETPSFDGIIKQLDARRAYLTHLLERGKDEVKQIETHFAFRVNEVNQQRAKQLADVQNRLSAIATEHDTIVKRQQALQTITGNLS